MSAKNKDHKNAEVPLMKKVLGGAGCWVLLKVHTMTHTAILVVVVSSEEETSESQRRMAEIESESC